MGAQGPLDRGIAAFNRGAFSEAADAFLEALKSKPRDANALFFRAAALDASGRREEALGELRRAVAVSPDSPTLVLQAARQLKAWGRLEEAARQCAKAGKLAPRSAAVFQLSAEIETARGRHAGALAAMAKAIRLEPNSPGLLIEEARLFKSLGRRPQALTACAKAVKKGGGEAAFSLLAELQAVSAKPKEAAQTLERALRKFPKSVPLWLQAAGLAKDRCREEEALAAVTRALRLSPRSAEVLLLKAELQDEVGLPAAGAETLRRAVHLDPRSSALRLRAAEFCLRRGEYGEARAHALAASSLDARSPAAAEAHARMELWHGDWAAAESAARAALSLDGGRAESWRILGAALGLQQRRAEGLAALDKVLDLGLDDAETRTWRGEFRRLDGDAAGALKELDAALAHWPNHTAALANKTVLLAGKISAYEFNEMTAVIPPALYPLREPAYRDDAARLVRAVEDVLRVNMLGNRSLTPTFLYKGRLRQHIHYFPRGPLQDLQSRLRFGRPERVLKEFSARAKTEPAESYLFSHRGETLLWLGRYAQAKRDLARALRGNDALLWPKVGLTACAIFQGRLDEARERLAYCEGRGGGRSILLPWRVELAFRRGEYKAALAFLRRDFKEELPFRPHLWVTKALCLSLIGDKKGRDKICRALRAKTPVFWADMEREAGKRPDAVLAHARAAFRGNRSRWLNTYFLKDGALKIVRFAGVKRERLPQQLRGQAWILEEAS